MIVCTTIDDVRSAVLSLRKQGRTIGWIPTMGALHVGHRSLMAAAVRQGDAAIVSIYVNPLQFGAHEDWDTYPRTREEDACVCAEEKVDILFIPEQHDVFSTAPITTVHVQGLSEVLCGRSRPTHFAGVTTILAKFAHIIQADKLYMGMKDAQQVAIVSCMVRDLSIPLTVVPCPTVREPDGLAYSSRNRYLSPQERALAPSIYAILSQVDAWCDAHPDGEAVDVRQWVVDQLRAIEGLRIDYVEVVSYPDLQPIVGRLDRAPQWIVAVAVVIGRTRLIDHVSRSVRGPR
jgi:pantoate--beta-alanine ligase